MNAYSRVWAFAMLGLFMISCSLRQPQVTVDVTLVNNTTNRLNWAAVMWGDEVRMSAGVFSPGKSATSLDSTILRPAPATNMAYFEFVDEEDPRLRGVSGEESFRLRRRLMQKVPVDVTPLKQLGPGSYRVTFALVTLTNAELTIRTKPKLP